MSFRVCVNFSWFAELGMDLCYAFVVERSIWNGHGDDDDGDGDKDGEQYRHMFKAFTADGSKLWHIS